MRKESLESDYNDLLQGRMSDQMAVSKLYDRCRGEFVAFVQPNFSLDRREAVELYQECFIALYENVNSGKLTTLTCSLKTYLIRIAKNKMLNRWRDKKTEIEIDDQFAEDNEVWTIQEQITYDVVQQMEEPCNTVLMLYYWERLSMDDIARKMNYAGAQVAKNRKLSCMRKLKLVLAARFSAEGILE